MTLNTDQLAAVNAREGSYQLLAGPGSGKTRVICERYRALVAEGVSPNEILCLTFTRQAAREMADRAGVDSGISRGGFLTFHAFAYKLLLRERKLLDFKLATEPVATGWRIRSTLEKLVKPFPLLTVKQARAYISLAKRRARSPVQAIAEAKDFTEQQSAYVYQQYEQAMKAEGLLDFDSMALEAYKLLVGHGEVAARWQFRYLMIDEAMDCDKLQWDTVTELCRVHGNVMAVGDANQCIYAWRGASPETFLNMRDYFPETRRLYMGINYRSSASIIGFCRAIAPVETGLTAQFCAESGRGDIAGATKCSGCNGDGLVCENCMGQECHCLMSDDADCPLCKGTGIAGVKSTEPEFLSYADDAAEAEGILAQIVEPETTAVLLRTNRQLRPLEDACLERGIAYRLLGRSGFWQRPEIQDVLAFARLALDPDDNDAVRRIVLSPHRPSKYLGKTFIDAIADCRTRLFPALGSPPSGLKRGQREASRKLYDFLKGLISALIIDTLRVTDCIELIIARAEMREYFAAENGDEAFGTEATQDNFALENLAELLRVAGRFENLRELVAHADKAEECSRPVICEFRSGIMQKLEASFELPRLTIGTIHQAKGKEWSTVYVAGVTQDILPHKLGDAEEEKRIFYVACSRAARRLVISAHGDPSEFWTAYAPVAQKLGA